MSKKWHSRGSWIPVFLPARSLLRDSGWRNSSNTWRVYDRRSRLHRDVLRESWRESRPTCDSSMLRVSTFHTRTWRNLFQLLMSVPINFQTPPLFKKLYQSFLLVIWLRIFPHTERTLLESLFNSPAVDFAREATTDNSRTESHPGVCSSNRRYPRIFPGEADKSGVWGSGRFDSGSSLSDRQSQEEGRAGGATKASRPLSHWKSHPSEKAPLSAGEDCPQEASVGS